MIVTILRYYFLIVIINLINVNKSLEVLDCTVDMPKNETFCIKDEESKLL